MWGTKGQPDDLSDAWTQQVSQVSSSLPAVTQFSRKTKWEQTSKYVLVSPRGWLPPRASESASPQSGETESQNVGIRRQEWHPIPNGPGVLGRTPVHKRSPCGEEPGVMHLSHPEGESDGHRQPHNTGLAGFWATQHFHSVLRTQTSPVGMNDQVTRSKCWSVLSELFNKHFCKPRVEHCLGWVLAGRHVLGIPGDMMGLPSWDIWASWCPWSVKQEFVD